MGRIRTIKPGFYKHEDLYEAEKASGLPLRVAFSGLWTVCDRDGRFAWKPRTLKTDVMPYDELDFSDVLEALVKFGFVEKYTAAGREYGQVPTFGEHQVINPREAKSVIPCRDASPRVNPVTNPARGEGKGRELEGKGVGTELARAPVEVPGLEIVHPLPPSRRDQAREAEAARLGTTPAIPHRFDPKWDPNDEHRARGHELGLTDDQMLEEAEDCRRKIYTHGFSTEDDQFFRELKWLATDLEKKRFQELNRHGRDKFENPGRDRSAG